VGPLYLIWWAFPAARLLKEKAASALSRPGLPLFLCSRLCGERAPCSHRSPPSHPPPSSITRGLMRSFDGPCATYAYITHTGGGSRPTNHYLFSPIFSPLSPHLPLPQPSSHPISRSVAVHPVCPSSTGSRPPPPPCVCVCCVCDTGRTGGIIVGSPHACVLDCFSCRVVAWRMQFKKTAHRYTSDDFMRCRVNVRGRRVSAFHFGVFWSSLVWAALARVVVCVCFCS